jgi:hypothetical protein
MQKSTQLLSEKRGVKDSPPGDLKCVIGTIVLLTGGVTVHNPKMEGLIGGQGDAQVSLPP